MTTDSRHVPSCFGTLLHEMEQTNQKQISITDPDSRSTTKNRKVRVGYNAQIAVDEEHKLIVAQDVTNEIKSCLSDNIEPYVQIQS